MANFGRLNIINDKSVGVIGRMKTKLQILRQSKYRDQDSGYSAAPIYPKRQCDDDIGL